MVAFAKDVAAAVLLEAGRELHYVDITDRMLRINLSNLATRGVTPEQTMGVILRKDPLFERGDYRGCYRLRNPERAAGQWGVRRVLEFMRRNRQPMAGV